MRKHVVIAGGGAAGFFAAINVAALCKNVRVTILEKSNKLLSKVRVSGGGRCNVTHGLYDAKLLTEKYPRGKKELINAFHRFNPTQTVEWFAQRGVKLKTEEDGRMFPVTDSSQTIIDCFLYEAEKYNIEISNGIAVEKILPKENKFILTLNDKTEIAADYFLIATGGSPNANSYNWIKQLGHEIISPVPSLFTFNVPSFSLKGLEGISVEQAQIKLSQTKYTEQGPLLITHWGLSGPAAIRLSAWAANYFFEKNYNVELIINWLPRFSDETLRKELVDFKKSFPQRKMYSKHFNELPVRLWERICELSKIKEETLFANISNAQINLLIENLLRMKFEVKGKTTYKEEFVTCGGVDLKQVNMKTMESKLIPNLFFGLSNCH